MIEKYPQVVAEQVRPAGKKRKVGPVVLQEEIQEPSEESTDTPSTV